MKKTLLISVLILLPIVSFAAIDIQKNSNGAILKTSNNAYMAGNMVSISQDNPGDVYAAGGTILATGKVNQDLVAAGGNIVITSPIGGDLRVAGGNINLGSQVNGELIVAGGQIEINPSSAISGDFIIAGGMVNIGGSMNSNGKIFGKEVHISGTLKKDVEIDAKSLTIESTAVINGNINYKGVGEAIIKDGAKVNGKISFTKIEAAKMMKPAGLAAVVSVAWFVKLLTMIAAALVMFFVMRRNNPKLIGETMNNFWKELLKGFILLIAIPAAAIILFVTIIGSLFGAFGIALYVLLLILGTVFSGIIISEILNRLIFRGNRAKPLNWPLVVLGVIVLQLLVFVPFVGWIARFAVMLVGLGAISNMIYRRARTIAE